MAMEYRFRSDIRAKDLWILAMLRIYKGFIGIINIVFTISVLFMSIRLFADANIFFRMIMILLSILFPVIQPAAIYGKCVKQLEMLPKDLELVFNDSGVLVLCGGKKEKIPWKNISNAIKQKNMIIIFSGEKHGYMISDRELGEKKEEFFKFICRKINKYGNTDK